MVAISMGVRDKMPANQPMPLLLTGQEITPTRLYNVSILLFSSDVTPFFCVEKIRRTQHIPEKRFSRGEPPYLSVTKYSKCFYLSSVLLREIGHQYSPLVCSNLFSSFHLSYYMYIYTHSCCDMRLPLSQCMYIWECNDRRRDTCFLSFSR